METLLAYWADVSIINAVFALISAVFLVGGIMNVSTVIKAVSSGQGAVTHTVVGWLGCIVLSTVLGVASYQNTRRAHWLRVGTSRYTVATIERNFSARSGRKFVFAYRVGSYQGQDQGECGEAGCPPVGSRRYVRFAAQAPDVSELTRWDVPDSLRHVPPLGWAELP